MTAPLKPCDMPEFIYVCKNTDEDSQAEFAGVSESGILVNETKYIRFPEPATVGDDMLLIAAKSDIKFSADTNNISMSHGEANKLVSIIRAATAAKSCDKDDPMKGICHGITPPTIQRQCTRTHLDEATGEELVRRWFERDGC